MAIISWPTDRVSPRRNPNGCTRVILTAWLSTLFFFGWHALQASAASTSPAPTAEKTDGPVPPASDTSGAAPAQPIAEVVVTGTHLSSPSLQFASPIAVVTPDAMRAGGATTVDAALTALPQVVASQDQFSGDGVGLSTVNLRGLGTSRTLVLVDGRRYVAADATQVVDLNTIPDALIDRVDVVTGGRSAVYGSDAIAGVINFILKKDFAGFETTGQYGETSRGDGGDLRFSTLLGVNSQDGRGNLTLFGEFGKRDAVLSRNRAYAATALEDTGTGQLIPGGSSSIVGGRLTGLGNDPSMRFLPDGSLVPYNFSGDSYNPAGDFYNYNPNLDLQVPSRRRVLTALGHYDIAPSLTVYEEAEFIDVNSATSGPPQPGFATPVTLQVASPFFPASTQAYLSKFDPTGSGYVSAGLTRRWVDFGTQSFVYDRQAIREVIGLRGDVGAGWTFDSYYNYSSSDGYLHFTNSLSQNRLQSALDTAFLDPATGAESPFPFAGLVNGGQLVCANAFARAQGCVPADVFGAGRMSPASIAYLAEEENQHETASTQVGNITLTNDAIAKLPMGGPLALDVGLEWRRQAANFVPDQATAAGDAIGLGTAGPVSGSYNVREAYMEMNAELIRDRPWSRLLSANAAARESDYSIATTGKVLSWSAGMTFRPADVVTFRGQFQRATRAPNVNDLFGAQNLVSVPGVDPCNNAVAASALAARCIATGVPVSMIGTVIDPNTQINDQQGGSPNLQAEVANTWTAGFILRPDFAPSANITVDYYKINISGYITAIGAANILSLCYQENLTPYCSRVIRSPTDGNILRVNDTAANSGGYSTSGVDLALQWQPVFVSQAIPVLSGDFNITSQATYLQTRTLTPVSALPQNVNACAGQFGVICGNPSPRWKAISLASWKHGPLTVTGQWQFIGPVSDDGGLGYPLAAEHLPGFHYFNANVSYEFSANSAVTLGVVNIANKLPPLIGDNSDANYANSWPATYDTIGRRFFVEGRYKF